MKKQCSVSERFIAIMLQGFNFTIDTEFSTNSIVVWLHSDVKPSLFDFYAKQIEKVTDCNYVLGFERIQRAG